MRGLRCQGTLSAGCSLRASAAFPVLPRGSRTVQTHYFLVPHDDNHITFCTEKPIPERFPLGTDIVGGMLWKYQVTVLHVRKIIILRKINLQFSGYLIHTFPSTSIALACDFSTFVLSIIGSEKKEPVSKAPNSFVFSSHYLSPSIQAKGSLLSLWLF